MTVVWSSEARRGLLRVMRYISRNFGLSSVEKFQLEVAKWVDIIGESPQVGSVDSLLRHRNKEYRSVVVRYNSKMVYYVEGEVIRIAAFWDTRQEPEVQTNHLK